METSFYADVTREMNRRKVRTVIDTDGEPLRLALAAEPTLVFPNQREAEALVGNEFQTDEDFQHALSAIEAMGAHGVVITLKTGCYALLAAGKTKARMFRAWIPRIEAVSTVGSGDALLAGFLAARVRSRPIEECLRQAVGCGTANTRSIGAGRFDPKDAARFAALSRVTELTGSAVEQR